MKAPLRVFLMIVVLAGMPSARALTLDEAVDETLEGNPFVRASQAELESAAGYRLRLHATTWPQARIGGVLGVQGGKRAGEESVRPFAFARGGFTQPLFNAAVPPSRRRGDVALLIAQQRFNTTVVEQLHRTRVAFVTALYNRSLETLRRSQRDVLDKNIESQEARYQAGAADRTLLMGARILARELDPRVETAHRTWQGALVELNGAMGRDLGREARLPEVTGDLSYAPVTLDLAQETATALRRRADLQLARLLIRAGHEDQRIIAAQYYPALTGFVAGDYIPVATRRGSEGSPQRSDDIISSELRVGVSMTWRVVDNGRTSGAVWRQKETIRANELTLDRLEANVGTQLAQLEAELRAIAARNRAYVSAAKNAERNAEIMRKTLDEGLASVLDFRGAESGLLDARSGLLTTAFQQQLALAEWDRATGRYLEFPKDMMEKLD